MNLQNARKIADYPYPFPLAQVSMILQLLHWATTPLAAALALPRVWAVPFSFFTIFVLWCLHFNALDLEFPFGNRVNDLPMQEFQQDWNNSICTLVNQKATRPPKFVYEPEFHNELSMVMSDASELYIPETNRAPKRVRDIATIRVSGNLRKSIDLVGRIGTQESQTVPESKELGSSSLGQPVALSKDLGRQTSPRSLLSQDSDSSSKEALPVKIERSQQKIVPIEANAASANISSTSSERPKNRSSNNHAARGTAQATLPAIGYIQPLDLDNAIQQSRVSEESQIDARNARKKPLSI